MAENRVSITINGKYEGGPAINKAKKDVDDLGTTSGKTGATVGKTSMDVDGLGKTAGSTGATVGKTAKEVDGLGKSAGNTGATVGKTSKDVDGLGKSATGAGNASGKAGKDVDGFGKAVKTADSSMSSALSTAMKFAGVVLSGLMFGSAIQSAYDYTKVMEDTKLGLASLAFSTMDFKNAQGELLSGQDAFNEALKLGTQVQEKLRIAGMTTAATYDQLANMVNVAWVPAMKAGFNPDQIIMFTQAVTQQATAMGMDLSRMGEEVKSILTGTMSAGNTQLKDFMETAGLTNAKIKELSATGKLFPAMMNAFEGATLAAAAANMNLSTVVSNLLDGIQGILGTAIAPFFDTVKLVAIDLAKHLGTVENGVFRWNQSLVDLGQTVASVMGAVVQWIYDHVMAVAKWIDANEDMIQIAGLVAIAVGSLWASLLLLQGISGIANAIIMFETTLEGLAAAIGLTNAMLAPWVIAIAAVAAAFALWKLYPIIKDIELFGHTIDTWLDLLKFKTQEIMAYAVEMFTNAFWNTPQEYIGKFLVLIADGIESFVDFWTSGNVISSILEWYKHIYYDLPLEYGSQFLSWLSGWFGSFNAFWSQGFSGIVSSATAWFTDLFVKKIPELLAGFGTKLGEWFGKIADFFKNFSLATAIDDIRNWGNSWIASANQGRQAAGDHAAMTLIGIQVSKEAAIQAEAKAKTEKTAAEQEKQARVEAEAKKTLAVKDNAEKVKKIQQDQNKLHEQLWKAQTELVEDETKQQLAKVAKEYADMKALAHGNANDLKAIDEWYASEKAQIVLKAAEKEKEEQAKKLKSMSDKHAEYQKIIQDNEEQSLDNRLKANQDWYDRELIALAAFAEKEKLTAAQLDSYMQELNLARAKKEEEIRSDVAKKEEEAIKEKVKAWDKAYEKIQETLTGFLENGKLDMDSFAKAFKNMAANLVSSWTVNMARMSLPTFLGGTASIQALSAGTALAGTGGSSGYTDSWMPQNASTGTASETFTLARIGASMMNMTNSFGSFLSGGWAQKLGGTLSNNGAGELGGWLTKSGTDGLFSGVTGAGIGAGIGSALLTGLTTGNWQKAAISGIGSGIGAAIGSLAGPAGTVVGGILGNIASSYIGGGDKYDDANLFMSIGDPNRSINEYDNYVGQPTKALYTPSKGDWIPNPNEAWSVQMDEAFMLDIRKGDSGVAGTTIIKLEKDISTYFKTVFKSIDNAFGVNVRKIIQDSRIGLGINLTKFEDYLKSGDISGALNDMTGQFFDVFGNAISTAIFNMDIGTLFNADALENLKRDSETAGETFIRVASLLKAVPEGIARLRIYMEQGLTEAEAFQKLEGQYTFVSGVIGNALSEAMQQGVKAADFESFQQTFSTSLQNQLKAGVTTAFQQQILQDVISASFGSLVGFGDMVQDLTVGKITITEFKTYMQTGMAAANAALEATKPIMQDLWNIIDLAPAATELEQARTFAGNVVSGAITESMKLGVEAASWDVFRNSIQTQLSAQLQSIVLNAFTSNMISSIMSTVFADGGGLGQLVTDFMNGKTSADQFSSTLGAVSDKMEQAAATFGPMFDTIIKAFEIKAKTDSTAQTAASGMAEQADKMNEAVEKFSTNKTDAALMLDFINGLISKIPGLVENYAMLDAALIAHKEIQIEYGEGLESLTISLSGYVREIRNLVNGLATAAGEASQRAANAAASAAAAAKSASDAAAVAVGQKDVMLGVLKNTKETVDALDRLNPTGDALQVRTV